MLKFLLVVLLLGVAIYVGIRLLQGDIPGRGGRGGGGVRRPGPPSLPPTRPVAPDDDPDFLRELDRKRRQRKRQSDPPEGPA